MMKPNATEVPLPTGVQLQSITMHQDERGCFSEIFRASWLESLAPVQWNFVQSEANVLRGVHVHKKHIDYLIIAQGQALVALRDLRKGSPTEGLAAHLELSGEQLKGVVIPPGVAHGFYFYTPAIHIYAVTEYWDEDDELGCYYLDPELGISWPTSVPILSERDRKLPPLGAISDLMPSWQPGE